MKTKIHNDTYCCFCAVNIPNRQWDQHLTYHKDFLRKVHKIDISNYEIDDLNNNCSSTIAAPLSVVNIKEACDRFGVGKYVGEEKR